MMNRNSTRTWATALLLIATGSVAATPTVTFDVQPRTLTLGEPAVATFTISGVNNPPPPTLPDLDAIRVEPNVSRSLQTSVVGTRISSSTTFRYRILPLEEGVLTVGPVDYELDGNTHTLDAVEIRVAPRPTAGGTSHTTLQDRLFARLTTDKPTYFMQESFDVILAIYSRNLRFGSGLRLQGLPNSGLEFSDFQELDATREMIDDKVFDVQRYRAQVRGITAGSFKVQPGLSVPIRVDRQPQRARSPFESFFSMRTEQVQEVTVLPELLTVEIAPLPEADRPPSFSGAVGQFSFEVKAQPQALQAGDPVTLTMQIQGTGNMDAVSAPVLEVGQEFKTYDARLVSKRMNDSRTRGEKIFEKVIIPRSDSIQEVPELQFSYFEPRSGTYKTLQQGPFRLEISANTTAVARVIQAAPVQEEAPAELSVLKHDIRYLHNGPPAWTVRRKPPWHANPLWLQIQLLPPILALVAAVATRRHRALEQDQARSRRRRASRFASTRLQAVRKARAGNDRQAFSEAVWEALSTYFGNRLNLAPGEVSAARVMENFESAGLDPDAVERIQQTFDFCEQARFGHGAGGDMSDDEKSRADQIVDTLGKVLRDCERVRL